MWIKVNGKESMALLLPIKKNIVIYLGMFHAEKITHVVKKNFLKHF